MVAGETPARAVVLLGLMKHRAAAFFLDLEATLPPKRACRSCGAPILWVTLTSGRRMPLDPEPSPGGNVVLIERDRAKVLTDLERAATAPERLYRHHNSSCPFGRAPGRGAPALPRVPRRRPGHEPGRN